MLGSDILEVIAGVVFVFILISTLCSAIREGLEAWLKTRASYLEHGLRELLQDKDGTGILSDLLNHPVIGGLYNGDYKPGKARKSPQPWHGGGNFPSYIPAHNFAIALMDIAARGPIDTDQTPPPGPGPETLTFESVRNNVTKIPNATVQRALLSALDHAHGDLDKARSHLETWYDNSMDRVSGWYRRSTHFVLFVVAIIVTVGLNVNSVAIADYLYRHAAERGVIVSAAEHAGGDKDPSNPGKTAQQLAYETAEKQLGDLHLPLGWSEAWETPEEQSEEQRTRNLANFVPFIPESWNIYVPRVWSPWRDLFLPLIGWLITAFAATLGAPFWFDVMGKITMIRTTAKPKSTTASA